MMRSVRQRLARLEDGVKASREECEEALSRKMLERMTTEELKEYRDALKRHIEGGKPAEEDAPIRHRRQQLYEEVRDEHAPAS